MNTESLLTLQSRNLPVSEVAPEPELEALESVPMVLLVEDNPGDVRLVREALAHVGSSLRLVIARDGLEAMRTLRDSPRRPDLILLDLKLPGMDGREVLKRIKGDPEFLRIPVIVVSGSDAARDVYGAYGLHANCYVVKPIDLQGYERTFSLLIQFWARTARLPDH